MKKHDPIKLNPAERSDLGSITKHPGMTVILERILEGHYQQTLSSIHDVAMDDPDRIVKLSAICAIADAQKLNIEFLKRELEYNWRVLTEQEEARAAEAAKQNETETTQWRTQ